MFERKSDIEALLKQRTEELQNCRTSINDIFAKNVRGVLILDETRTILLANSVAETIFGCTNKELVGRTFDLPLTPGEPGEAKMLTREGKEITVEIWTIKTEWNGKPAYYVSLQDITRRKEQEQELRKLYRAITHSPSMVLITDDEARIEYVNPKFTEVTGFTFAEVMGKTPAILRSGMVAPEVFENLWETISSGTDWKGELVNRKKNGDIFYESASISPVKDFNGKITNYIAVKEDITQRKLLEAELERLSLPQLNPNPILELDSDSRLTFANKAAEEILKTLPDSSLNPFIPEDMPDILRALQEKSVQSYVREVGIKDRIFEEHLHLVPQFNVIRIYAMDVTALRRAEEQVEQLTARLLELTGSDA